MPSAPREPHAARQSDSSSSTRKLSCSECRRLKLRCDRKWPCQSCVKRGCASICPTGSLTPGGGGNRFILHGSEELHSKIREMGARIAALEDTVGCMWAAKTGGKEGEHPMLRKELLKIKEMPDTQNVGHLIRESPNANGNAAGTGAGAGQNGSLGSIREDERMGSRREEVRIKEEAIEECGELKKEDCIVSGLGTLTIGDNGRRNYMGRSARIEFIMAGEDLNVDPEESLMTLTSPSPSAPSSSHPSPPQNHDFTDSSSGHRTSATPSSHNGHPQPYNTPPTPASSLGNAASSSSTSHPYSYPPVPEAVASLSQAFIVAKPASSPVTLKTLVALLPPIEHGSTLLEAFFENAAWFYAPLRRDMFIDIIFSYFYKSGPDRDMTPDGAMDSSGLGMMVGQLPKGLSWARVAEGNVADCIPGDPTRSSPTAAAPMENGCPGETTESWKPTTKPGPAELSCLFMVLSIGSLVDLTQPVSPASALADRFYTLAKAALCLEMPYEHHDGSTTAVVQALNMLSCYSCMWSAKGLDVEKNWAYVGMASRTALSLGLHRDSSRFNLPCFETQMRRYVFWELFSLDSWTSLAYGRPPSLNLRHVDCQFPQDKFEKRDERGKVVSRSFKVYKYMFLKECVWPVIEHIFDTKQFTYSNVQALDRKVRAFDFGTLASEVGSENGRGVAGMGGGGNAEPSMAGMMQRQLVLCIKENVLLYIHRSFFTRVMMENPNNPLDSPWAASVLATFRCAVTVLQVIRNCLIKQPILMSRFWLCWSHLMTSAVVTGSICYRGPKCTIAPAAFAQLRIAVELFENSREYTPRLNYVMPILYRLQDKAYKAIVAVGPGPSSVLPPAGRPESVLGPSASRRASSNNLRSPTHVHGGQASAKHPDGRRDHDTSDKDYEADNCDPLAAYGGRARVIHLDSATKANVAANGEMNCGAFVQTIKPRSDGKEMTKGASSSKRQLSATSGGGGGGLGGGSRSLKSSLWFDANFMNRDDAPDPLGISPFVTTASQPSAFAPNSVGLGQDGTMGGANSSQFAPLQNSSRPAYPPYMEQDSIQPSPISSSNQTSNTASASTHSFPDPAVYSLSNISAKSSDGQQGGNGPTGSVVRDDYSWLDGFGMGTGAPVDQFPVVGPQTVPMLFDGGVSGGGSSSTGRGNGGPRNTPQMQGAMTGHSVGGFNQGLPMHINDFFGGVGSNGDLSGHNGRVDGSGSGTSHGSGGHPHNSGMMSFNNSERLPPGMFGTDRTNVNVADSLPSSMFGFSTANTDSLPNYGTTNHLSMLFPPQLSLQQQQQYSSQLQPMPSPPSAHLNPPPNPQNSWFFTNFSSTEEPSSTYDMNMNIDSIDDTAMAGNRPLEPALNDASWQEYMRQVFVNGVTSGNGGT